MYAFSSTTISGCYFQTILFLVDVFNMRNRNITRRLVLGNSGSEIFVSLQFHSKKWNRINISLPRTGWPLDGFFVHKFCASSLICEFCDAPEGGCWGTGLLFCNPMKGCKGGEFELVSWCTVCMCLSSKNSTWNASPQMLQENCFLCVAAWYWSWTSFGNDWSQSRHL